MSRSSARVDTEHASQYLQQLCKHFAHKLPVQFTPVRGHIPFAAGTCTLAADDAGLTLEAEASGADGLARVQDVVERHLVRFAFREPLTVHWRPAEPAA